MVDVVARLSGPLAPRKRLAGARSARRGRPGGQHRRVAGGGGRAGPARGAGRGRRARARGRGRPAPGGVTAGWRRPGARRPAHAWCSSRPAASGRWMPDAGANDALARETSRTTCSRPRHLHVAGYALLRTGSRRRRARRSSAPAARACAVGGPVLGTLMSPASWTGLGARPADAQRRRGTALAGEPPERRRGLAERSGEVVVKLGEEGALWTDGWRGARGGGAGRGASTAPARATPSPPDCWRRALPARVWRTRWRRAAGSPPGPSPPWAPDRARSRRGRRARGSPSPPRPAPPARPRWPRYPPPRGRSAASRWPARRW